MSPQPLVESPGASKLRAYLSCKLTRPQRPEAVLTLQVSREAATIIILGNSILFVYAVLKLLRFYSARNARIASAVLATAIRLSVRLSVCLSVTRRYCVKTAAAHSTVQFAPWIAKCVYFCRNQKIFPRDDPFPLKFWLKVTYPLLKAASFDTFCLVAPQP